MDFLQNFSSRYFQKLLITLRKFMTIKTLLWFGINSAVYCAILKLPECKLEHGIELSLKIKP